MGTSVTSGVRTPAFRTSSQALRGFTKKQVYDKRDHMSQAGLIKIKVPKV
jgi:hypothetical protein